LPLGLEVEEDPFEALLVLDARIEVERITGTRRSRILAELAAQEGARSSAHGLTPLPVIADPRAVPARPGGPWTR
jgi:hypothetical protein